MTYSFMNQDRVYTMCASIWYWETQNFSLLTIYVYMTITSAQVQGKLQTRRCLIMLRIPFPGLHDGGVALEDECADKA